MSKQLENANMEKFQTEELHDLSIVGGAGVTSTTSKKTLEDECDKDSSAESTDSFALDF
jgi:hypothetical protein